MNEISYLLRTKLFKALLALRYAVKERQIWVEAPCLIRIKLSNATITSPRWVRHIEMRSR